MRRSILTTALVAMLCISLVPFAASDQASARLDPDLGAPSANGRAIVVFDHEVDDRTMSRLASVGVTHAVKLASIDGVGVIGPMGAYEQIASWEDVSVVDADSRVRFDLYESVRQIKADQVHEGRDMPMGYSGKSVTVAVVDTGIDGTHPDLDGDKVVADLNFEGGWFFDMIEDGVYSDRTAEMTGNPVDSYGHGTHVAGIVGGTGEAAAGGLRMQGVAPRVSLANFKIADVVEGVSCSLPCDLGWEINALVAFEYMIEHRNDPRFPGGIRVSTNSWSVFEIDDPDVEPINLMVRAAIKKGIITLFAAGNDGPDPDSVVYPGAVPEVITVAASCREASGCDEIAGFSSRGAAVDVTAPGVGIFSAKAKVSMDGWLGPPPQYEDDDRVGPADFASNASSYVGLSGTSMATPHVAGIAALMVEAFPGITHEQTQDILKATAIDKGAAGFDNEWGAGLVDALAAVKAARCLGSGICSSEGGMMITQSVPTSGPTPAPRDVQATKTVSRAPKDGGPLPTGAPELSSEPAADLGPRVSSSPSSRSGEFTAAPPDVQPGRRGVPFAVTLALVIASAGGSFFFGRRSKN